MKFKFISYIKHPIFQLEGTMALEQKPYAIYKLFGGQPKTRYFYGGSTVWHEIINNSLYRCSLSMELMLSEFYKEAQYHENNKTNN